MVNESSKSPDVHRPVTQVLFPTDLSSSSQLAFPEAERFAKALGARLIVLYVAPPPDYWSTGGEPVELDPETVAALRAVRPVSSDVPVEHVTHIGLAGEVICWVAQELDCDLIVMSTHGHSGLKHLLFGSVAEYVIRHARCPVTTVRQHAADEKRLPEPQVYQRMPPII
ncbi:MAG: universal stress protein [Planctomycetales bacterium]|nr:universal stress protein [Planctomycetales bacterium]